MALSLAGAQACPRFGGDVRLFIGVAWGNRVNVDVGKPAFTVTAGMKYFASDGRVPMVLDGVVRPSREQFGDVRPLVAVLRVRG